MSTRLSIHRKDLLKEILNNISYIYIKINKTKESKEVINLEETRRKEKIKACIAIAVIVLAIIITGIISMKYYVEGETNMPFTLSKITIVSTAEGVENEGAQEKWNLSIFQNNDIYFSIEKNDNNKEDEIIESVSIENIQVLENPKVGQIKTYMPNSSDGRLFSYSYYLCLHTIGLKKGTLPRESPFEFNLLHRLLRYHR